VILCKVLGTEEGAFAVVGCCEVFGVEEEDCTGCL
jgi:hypothetical protein